MRTFEPRSDQSSDVRMRAASDEAVILDESGIVLHAAPVVVAALGHRAGDLVGRRLGDVLHPDDHGVLAWHLSRLARGEADAATLVARACDGDGHRLVEVELRAQRCPPDIDVVVALREIHGATSGFPALFAEAVHRAVDAVAVVVGGRTCVPEVVFVNPAFATVTGYEPGDIVGHGVAGLIGEHTAREDHDRLVAALRDGEHLQREMVLRRADGSPFAAEVTVTPTSVATEASAKQLLVVRDVSVRRADADALQHRLAWLGAQFESAGLGVLVVDGSGIVLEANPSMARLVEADDDAIRGGHFTRYTHVEDLQRDWDSFQSLLEGNSDRQELEHRLVRSDGAPLWVKTTKSAIRDSTGATLYVVSLVEDISERRRAVEALRVSEQRHRAVIDGIRQVVYQVDAEGRLTFLSQAWEDLTGVSVGDSVSRSCLEFIHADDHVRASSALRRVVETREDMIGSEIRYVTRSGATRVVTMCARALTAADGKVVGASGVLEDITERQQQEVELRHVQRLESVGRLAAGIAHEINTPIQFVGDNLHFLADSFTTVLGLLTSSTAQEAVRVADTDGELEYLAQEIPQAIQQSAEGVERVASIVRAMKAFGHPDRAEQHAADINEALLNTITVSRNEHKYVADVVTELAELPAVTCYIGDLNQVFLNLLVNAAHAISEATTGRRGTITVRTWTEGDDVAISISDDGIGMPEQVRERIFDPFFTTKDVGQGTGQGLALARSVIADKHNGRIDVESETGIGTTFVIRLPVAGRPTERQGVSP